ncbi:MAG TPA: sensor histidine kinase [Rectinemataceae bacterium]|nr:sensor histidine kinase [Rectinemataceae bacterium]
MQHEAAPAQSTAAQVFIALIALVLVVYVAITWSILGRIEELRSQSRDFFDRWLECKSEAVLFLATTMRWEPSALVAEFDACDRLFARISAGPHASAARLFQDLGMIDLKPAWEGLRASLGLMGGGDPQGRDPLPRLQAFTALAKGFETAFRTRMAAIDAVAEGQNRALLTLQLSAIAAVLGLAGLSAWISRIAHRAQEGGKRLAELVGATFAAQEAERRRISLDLHDSVAQEVSAALMTARRLAENQEGTRAALIASLKTTIDALRRISWEMRPPELERFGFQGAAMRLLEAFSERSGLSVEAAPIECDVSGLSESVAMHLYRILQESLMNIQKHAGAKAVRVEISRPGDSVRLVVEDDGCGFDATAQDGAGPAHLGIAGMRERARLIGGLLAVSSAPGRGTRLKVEAPYA